MHLRRSTIMSERVDKRIVIVGAGSRSFGLGTLGDLMTTGDELWGSTIVLHDLSQEMLDLVGGVFKRALAEAADADENGQEPFKVEATTDPVEALRDADFVVMTIEHGNRLRSWEQDYYIPLKHGCKQVYGENGGPGGAFHTWRQVPPMLRVAEIMHDVAPNAFLLNYSNPVPRVTWAINRYMERLDPAFPRHNIGFCHGIGSGLRVLPRVLGANDFTLDVTSAGLNHFYFFIKVEAKKDYVMPALGPFPEKQVHTGDDLLPDIRERAPWFFDQEESHFVAELIRVYGYWTYPEQSHPAEYVHWANCYCPHVKYGFKSTNDPLKQQLRDSIDMKTDNFWWVHQTGERAVPVIVGITFDTNQKEIALNMQNIDGCISNLPRDCTVEAPAHVNASGAKHDEIGPMPRGIVNLLQHEATIQDLVVEAAITGDYNVALQALSLDPTVPSPQVARELLDDMLRLQKDYLPQFADKQ